jgi:alpha-1,3-rhamnosyl/mannosyltransferase
VRADKQFAAKVLSRADGLVAVSQHTRSDAVNVMGLDPDRIEVIYPGVPDAYFQANSESAGAARQKLGLTRNYILSEGTIEPRKNLGRLLDAYASLPQSLREEFDLVVAGFPGWANEGLLKRIGSKPSGVRYLGYVPEPWVPGLFAGATVFAFPSLYEGFGLPLAQAMAVGVATITSHVSALPEVAGDAALLIDPLNTAELSSALAKLLTSSELRNKLGAAGRKRAEEFRWDRCACQTVKYFEKIAGRL